MRTVLFVIVKMIGRIMFCFLVLFTAHLDFS